jgi:hypothetical protein
MVDLDSDPTKLIDLVTIGKQLLTHIPHPQLSQIKKAIKVVHTN